MKRGKESPDPLWFTCPSPALTPHPPPKRHAPSCVASRHWSPISPIEIEIEIEIGIGIGIGIDPCHGWHLAYMDRLNFAAEL